MNRFIKIIRKRNCNMPKIIENVREQLLAVAKKQISERGYANTTIRSVAGECGLGVGTVYNYFKSKDMLIASFMAEDWRACLDDINASPVSSAEELLQLIYDALINFSRLHKTLFADADATKVFFTVFSERHKLLRDQIAQILIPICPEENAPFVSEFVAEALITWTVAGKDFEDIASQMMKILK